MSYLDEDYKFHILYGRSGPRDVKDRALEVARYLKTHLQNANLGPGYVADDDVLPGQDIFQAVQRATRNSQYTICILTDGWTHLDDHMQKMAFKDIHDCAHSKNKGFIVVNMFRSADAFQDVRNKFENIPVLAKIDIKYSRYNQEQYWLEKIKKCMRLGIGVDEVVGSQPMAQPQRCTQDQDNSGVMWRPPPPDPHQLERGTFSHQSSIPNAVSLQDIQVDGGAESGICSSSSSVSLRSEAESFTSLPTQVKEAAWDCEDQPEGDADPEEVTFEDFIRRTTSFVGQQTSIKNISAALATREYWTDEHPLVLLFVGPSGVGKTEVAKQIAKYKDEGKSDQALLRFDMSEFSQKHEVSKFLGAPPGYEGYKDGGQLTGRLANTPNAVVLFDEVDKAHTDILTIMLQLFDEGRITDGKGNCIECKDATFILTANLGNDEIIKFGEDRLAKTHPKTVEGAMGDLSLEEEKSIEDFIDQTINPILKSHFKRDELLGRISETFCFMPFTPEECLELVKKELVTYQEKAREKYDMKIEWSNEVVAQLAKAYNIPTGVRSIKVEIKKSILNKLSAAQKKKILESGMRCRFQCSPKAQDPSGILLQKYAATKRWVDVKV